MLYKGLFISVGYITFCRIQYNQTKHCFYQQVHFVQTYTRLYKTRVYTSCI